MSWYNLQKRLFDVFFSTSMLILLSPLYAIIALAIKSTSKGSIIFKQKRVGKNQKIFTIYKFRTMVENAEELKEKYRHLNEVQGPVFKIDNDPRHTRIGRFLSHASLDELPQFFNVLKGEMSIVGFRPPTLDEVKKYEKWQFERFQGKPGLTSLWAVTGGHTIKFDDWIKMDIKYNKNSSFLYDLDITSKTALMFIKQLLK